MFYWVLCRWRPALQEHWYISSLWKATASSNSEDGTRELVSVCSFFACSPLVEGLQSISFLFLQKKKTIYGKISVSDCMCLRLSSVPLQCQAPSGYSEALSEAAVGLTGRATTHLLPVPQVYLCKHVWWHACPSGTCVSMMLSCICCHAV